MGKITRFLGAPLKWLLDNRGTAVPDQDTAATLKRKKELDKFAARNNNHVEDSKS